MVDLYMDASIYLRDVTCKHRYTPLMSQRNYAQQAILFDLDGTLINTIGDIAFAINRVLHHVGAPPIDDETCKRFVGQGLRNALCLALREALVSFDNEQLDSYMTMLMDAYRAHPYDRATIYPGIEQLLEKSVAGDLKLGVLSNKEDSLVRQIVESLLGDVPFITVQGAIEGLPLKPNPSAAHAFAKAAGCTDEDVLLVGDSEVDFLTAKAARMQIAVVTWGFRDRFNLESNGCGPLYDTIEELETEVLR